MKPPDDTMNAPSAAVQPFTMPLPLTWSVMQLAPPSSAAAPLGPTPAPKDHAAAPCPSAAATPASAERKSQMKSAAAAAAPPSKRQKAPGKAPAKRVKWSNEMVGELLRLRFADGDVKRRLESADTKTKKALAWQHCASVLAQSLGIVLTHDQVSLKYRKLKCMYRKEKPELRATGNGARESEMDAGLWFILSDAFGGRVGISGDVLLDSSADVEDEDECQEAKEDGGAKSKPPPVAQLATALQGGMEAIAASLGSRPAGEDYFRSLTAVLLQQHEETRRFQEMQLQLLQELVAKKNE